MALVTPGTPDAMRDKEKTFMGSFARSHGTQVQKIRLNYKIRVRNCGEKIQGVFPEPACTKTQGVLPGERWGGPCKGQTNDDPYESCSILVYLIRTV